MSADFLAAMAASSRARANAARALCDEATLLKIAEATPPAPRLVLSPERFDLIAEVKLRSPAVGQLKGGDEDIATRVTRYAAAGAAAISVLTEPTRFDGSLDHLRLASRALLAVPPSVSAPTAAGAVAAGALATCVPAMRKDFLVDPYQAIEARVAGAGGLLVILRMLDAPAIDALLEISAHLQLFVLLEAFDVADIDLAAELIARHAGRARAAQAPLLVGVNCRDLSTLQVVPDRLEEYADRLPKGAPRVAESGVTTAADAARIAAAGYELALVGSALMQHAEAGQLVGAMLRAGRDARTFLHSTQARKP